MTPEERIREIISWHHDGECELLFKDLLAYRDEVRGEAFEEAAVEVKGYCFLVFPAEDTIRALKLGASTPRIEEQDKGDPADILVKALLRVDDCVTNRQCNWVLAHQLIHEALDEYRKGDPSGEDT